MPYLIVKQTKKTLSKGKFLDRENGQVFERERVATDRESYLNSVDPVCWVPWIDMAITFSSRQKAEQVRRNLPAEGISVESM
ncbi:hypothetical protein [Immundisolibacter sp.]|uniref:hypothetical protein n=1 Tax=Immundisolibacter sp. TaxID=1934948 RepID=UPI0035622AAB